MATAVLFASWAWGDPISGWWLLVSIPFDAYLAAVLGELNLHMSAPSEPNPQPEEGA